MKTKIIPFDLETAKKIQAGEIEGKIKTKGGVEVHKMCFTRSKQYGLLPFSYFVLEVPDDEPQFKPFDKVLVRDSDNEEWEAGIFSHMISPSQTFACVGNSFMGQCIPYEGNEHLLGTTDNPKED